MSSLKSIWAVCAQNFRKWRTDYRIWTIAALMLIMTAIYIDDMRAIAAEIEEKVPIWTFPFLYSQFHTKLIFTLPVILLFCGAPFVDENQTFVIMRSGRTKWLCGQLLYIVITSALYYLFLLVATLLMTVFTGELSLEWGKTLPTIANTGIVHIAGRPFVSVSSFVLTYFSPIQAVWFTFILSWLSAILLGAVLFMCNYLTRTRIVGMSISSALVVLAAVARTGEMPRLLWVSPVSWNTLESVDVGGLTLSPPFYYCIGVYCGLILLLFTAVFIFGKRKNLDKRW